MKKKINALRTYYSKELFKSITRSGAGKDEAYESKWPHFQSLMFLRDTINSRKTTSSFVCTSNKFILPRYSTNCVEIFTKFIPYRFIVVFVIVTA